MRIAITAVLLAANAVATGLSVALLGFSSDTSNTLGALLPVTGGLWALFALSMVCLFRVPGRRAGVVLVLVGAVGIGGAALLGAPNTSTDSARYAWDGIVQNAGNSPYDFVPADPALRSLRPEWIFPEPVVAAAVAGGGVVGGDAAHGYLECPGARITTVVEPQTGRLLCTAINRPTVTTIYPPAAQLLFAGVRSLVAPTAEYWPMQVAGLLIFLAVTVLLLRGLISCGRDPRWSALWAWCPLVATEGVTNSHVDVFAALLLLVATLLASTRRPWLAGLALGASISVKLIPAIGSFAMLRRNPLAVIGGAVAVFALLYVPYVLASGPTVVGYLFGYLNEEGFSNGTRFLLISLVAPGPAAAVVAVIVLAGLAVLVTANSDPDDPWLAQVVMIGVTLLVLSPRYPWYALLLVPMVAMTGRWEWMAVPLALTVRLLVPSPEVSQVVLSLAIVAISVAAWRRAGPGGRARAWADLRHPLRPRLRTRESAREHARSLTVR